MPKIDRRIVAIEAKLKEPRVQQQQLKVIQQRKEARLQSVEAKRTRREEIRRKFLDGAIVLAKIELGILNGIH